MDRCNTIAKILIENSQIFIKIPFFLIIVCDMTQYSNDCFSILVFLLIITCLHLFSNFPHLSDQVDSVLTV